MLQARLLRTDQVLEPTLDWIQPDAAFHPRCASELSRRKPHLIWSGPDLNADAGDTAATLLLRYGMAEWAGARCSKAPLRAGPAEGIAPCARHAHAAGEMPVLLCSDARLAAAAVRSGDGEGAGFVAVLGQPRHLDGTRCVVGMHPLLAWLATISSDGPLADAAWLGLARPALLGRAERSLALCTAARGMADDWTPFALDALMRVLQARLAPNAWLVACIDSLAARADAPLQPAVFAAALRRFAARPAGGIVMLATDRRWQRDRRAAAGFGEIARSFGRALACG